MAMMSIDRSCPHCLKEKAMLTFIKEAHLKPRFFSLVFQCNSCFRLVIAEVETTVYGGPEAYAKGQLYPVIVNKHPEFKVSLCYPSQKPISAPESTPERAAKFFIEAKEDFARGRYETSAMNCRKVIDIATKSLHLGDEDKLVRRISALRATGLITQEMADWAHIIRIDTNGAVHSDEEFTKEEVDQLLKFTEVFLTYSFTLPAMVATKREIE
ncbi:DUF4145 domain-containing protein [Klebsiella pneumoniae]|uniref:DUF4145 domain-containing protein n=1 Tax=Klebsiella pneumoniae complex TaxID=3390273 RepID=UPI0005B3B526|nr:DUF4145 domain-containing protein [Klebsiella pneumoniae]MCQ0846651.1 DUF4145 domain-containing protein [Klebsiella pneumoniae]MEA4453347.1 DUF4145 domain-containing protein [Klebsiella pneumoniae]QKK71735.1 hypothetical protein MS14393_02360 [Klebsiella pneumoniae]CAE7112257.1 hypothetical protein AI2702V1_3717 [Klebsiella pneumoniae]CAH3843576.1 hypothetical protein AI2702V1_3717 [Klebsiella pneumoniae]